MSEISLGVGGRGLLPGRDHDTFGLGYYYSAVSDDLPDILNVDDAQGVELYYNIHATPWLRITPDIQFIDSGFDSVDDAWVLGLRVRMDF